MKYKQRHFCAIKNANTESPVHPDWRRKVANELDFDRNFGGKRFLRYDYHVYFFISTVGTN